MNKDQRKRLESVLAEFDMAVQNAILNFQEVADEEQEKFGNLPEGLQNGEKGEALQNSADALNEAVQELEQITDVVTGHVDTATS